MRRKFAFFFVITFALAVAAIQYNPKVIEEKPDVYEVTKYLDTDINNYTNTSNDFYLLFDSYKLDSNNFEQVLSFFDGYDYYKISKVYPYINPLYQSILKNISVITYDGHTLKDGISNIYNKYMAELEEYRLSDEIDKVLVNGIQIRMIKVKVNNEVLRLFLQKYNNVKYSLSPYGLFKSL